MSSCRRFLCRVIFWSLPSVMQSLQVPMHSHSELNATRSGKGH